MSGNLPPTPAQNNFMPRAGAGRFDDDVDARIGAHEVFRDGLGEGIDGRRADDLDVAATTPPPPEPVFDPHATSSAASGSAMTILFTGITPFHLSGCDPRLALAAVRRTLL